MAIGQRTVSFASVPVSTGCAMMEKWVEGFFSQEERNLVISASRLEPRVIQGL